VIDTHRMNLAKGTKGQAQIGIEVLPEAVYDLVSKVSEVAEWSPECVSARWHDPDAGAVSGASNGSILPVSVGPRSTPCGSCAGWHTRATTICWT
jgi:hypothetical protein